MGSFTELQRAITKLGIRRTISLIFEKQKKKKRIEAVLAHHNGFASLRQFETPAPAFTPEEKLALIEKADAMLRDENFFFTFPYKTTHIEDPWNYDPLEKRYWQKKRYEETRVHGNDTPKDVKIVWEVNRFKDLPLLAQAAYLTQDKRYADEVERRLCSWIECNPFGATINWSSPLELAIRIISWTVSLRLLSLAGFEVASNATIKRSIYEHAVYLSASLSTDKIVHSNHLIGEAVGLLVVCSLFELEGSHTCKPALPVIEDSVLRQTYPDGASRESSGWYHGFVTDFAEIAARVASLSGEQFSPEFYERFEMMLTYKNSIYSFDGIIKYGDFDNGKALELSPAWRQCVFGESPVSTQARKDYFPSAHHVSAHLGSNSLFVRAGEFGWGGDGFSSHAHDDFLSPVVFLQRHPMLVDPGTYVYNGDAENRDRYRVAGSHNSIIIGGETGAELKPSFGWKNVRPDSSIDFFSRSEDEVIVEASFGETKCKHLRRFILRKELFSLEDHIELSEDTHVTWHFHFHPRWRIEKIRNGAYALRDFRGHEFLFELSTGELEFEVLDYDFSPSYMEKSRANKLRCAATLAPGAHNYRFEITRSS